jgi:PAS domain S-box-containing protein
VPYGIFWPRFGTLPNGVSRWTAVKSRDGKAIEFNAAAERTFGYKRAQAIGRAHRFAHTPLLRDAHAAGFARYLATGEGRQVNGSHGKVPL